MRKRRIPGPLTVILVSLSIAMGIQAHAAAKHQVLDISPHISCGMELSCGE